MQLQYKRVNSRVCEEMASLIVFFLAFVATLPFKFSLWLPFVTHAIWTAISSHNGCTVKNNICLSKRSKHRKKETGCSWPHIHSIRGRASAITSELCFIRLHSLAFEIRISCLLIWLINLFTKWSTDTFRWRLHSGLIVSPSDMFDRLYTSSRTHILCKVDELPFRCIIQYEIRNSIHSWTKSEARSSLLSLS